MRGATVTVEHRGAPTQHARWIVDCDACGELADLHINDARRADAIAIGHNFYNH